MLTQAAQIYARQFSSLQPDLRMWDPGIYDFVEAQTNLFMNFLFAIWIHSSQNLRRPLIRTLLLITMSRQDLTFAFEFYWKVNSNDIRRLCKRFCNFYKVRPGEPWCVGTWEQAPKTSSKSSTAVQSQSYNYLASCSRLWLRTIKSPYI